MDWIVELWHTAVQIVARSDVVPSDVSQTDRPATVRNIWAHSEVDFLHRAASPTPEIGLASKAALHRQAHCNMMIGVRDFGISQTLEFSGELHPAGLQQQDGTSEALKFKRQSETKGNSIEDTYVWL